MDFILQQGYDVKHGKMAGFQAWLGANEKELRNSTPDGVEYLGTYVAVHTSEKQAGSIRTLWRLDSYGAQDNLAAAGKLDGPFKELGAEWFQFIDTESDNWSDVLMKSVVDATIWSDE